MKARHAQSVKPMEFWVVVPFQKGDGSAGVKAERWMHFDINEAIRRKQQKQPKTIVIPNGKVVVLPGELGEEIDPSEIEPADD